VCAAFLSTVAAIAAPAGLDRSSGSASA
jgi:hypothetical protein